MIRKQEALQLLAYTGVATFSVGAAFLIAMKFTGLSSAQNEPESTAQESAAEARNAPNVQNAPSEQDTSEASESVQAPDVPIPPSPDATVNMTTGTPPETEAAGGGLAEIEGFLEPFIYDIVNRRDPFLAYAEYVPMDEGPARPMSAAQRFAIEDLKLVGVMWDVKDPKALFQDPESAILTLGRDDSIGNRNGYIAAIREGEVVVVEAIRRKGDIIYRTKVLRIER